MVFGLNCKKNNLPLKFRKGIPSKKIVNSITNLVNFLIRVKKYPRDNIEAIIASFNDYNYIHVKIFFKDDNVSHIPFEKNMIKKKQGNKVYYYFE